MTHGPDDMRTMQEEVAADAASRDTPPNRTERELLDRSAVLDRHLAAFDDLDDLGGLACEFASRVAEAASQLRVAAVAFDRARGASWQDIGGHLNVTKQAAW
jgi:hypothetical protein